MAGVICCVIALLVARHWAATGERVAASVTGCAVWFPDTGLHRCDHHWSFDGESFIGRFPGGDWPDGHSATLWMNPDDPTDVDLRKSVASPVVFAVFGLGLLLATGWLIGWSKFRSWIFPAPPTPGAPPPARTRRPSPTSPRGPPAGASRPA